MIGEKELRDAASDVIASAGAMEDAVEAKVRVTESAGLDYEAATKLGKEGADLMVQLDAPVHARFRSIFLEGLLIGIRCGRADAAKTAHEMVSNAPKGISGYDN
jgi:hypothetical protein